MISRRAFSLSALPGAVAAGGGLAWSALRRRRRGARPGRHRQHHAPTRHGVMEYAVAGEGPPVLMIHGTGGGFDQGLLFARRLVAAGYRVIAPSRFGYLRSALPADPSSEDQADAFVDLLDALGIDRVPVVGGSAGALSAIAFALRHPDRCTALVALVPAPRAGPLARRRRRARLTELIITRGAPFGFPVLAWPGDAPRAR